MESRRTFLKKNLALCAGSGFWLQGAEAEPIPQQGSTVEEQAAESWAPVEAQFYEKIEDLKIRCKLCPKECAVADRERGYCGVRENRSGTYWTLVHSRPCSIHVDPIEKKPLYHFMPGHKSYSLATVGCNMECRFCQNWEISQFTPEQRSAYHLTPAQVVEQARQAGCRSIAYTYTEPVIFYEYMLDCARAGQKAGVKSVMISNGYIQEKPLRKLIPFLDAVKIDLKAFTDSFYRELCSGELEPVLKTLKILKETGIWFEIVVLLIPTKNDSVKEIGELCAWVIKELSDTVPVHFNRFHPVYKIKDLPRTPVSTLENAMKIARGAGIKFPYIGNLQGKEWGDTFCSHCGKPVISRVGFYLAKLEVNKGNCNYCGKPLPGVW
ncbi:MAG: AmmeMemoRadiSam system radical SAM enzyme [Planctomycetes bacterium]|nr:AmmeMemoRadiSam system radical SAM enzyme [Planctomycetota bacterium]